MRAEIIGVGTELLLGEVVNTNAAFIGQQLAELGIPCYHISVVGDNPERLREVLEIAVSRSDLIITTGGLGPTKDDLTKETIAAAIGVPLEFHQGSWDHLVAKLAARGRQPETNHRREALMPVGAVVFPNPQGTANALAISFPSVEEPQSGVSKPRECPDAVVSRRGGAKAAPTAPQPTATIIMLPGPPREMSAVFIEEVAPYLKQLSDSTIVSHNLQFFGIGESQLEVQLPEGLLEQENPTAALYAGTGEVRLRISARSENEQQAESLIEPIINQLKEQFGPLIYGIDTNLQTALVQTLNAKGLTIAVAESCTGGRIASKITEIPGSSEIFGYGVVTYANSAKMELLGVRGDTLAQFGAVSEETAIEMAEGVKNLSGADIGVGVTGIAGPDGGTPEKPVGTVWIGVASPNGVEAKLFHLDRGIKDQRNLIQELATLQALSLALKTAHTFASVC